MHVLSLIVIINHVPRELYVMRVTLQIRSNEEITDACSARAIPLHEGCMEHVRRIMCTCN